MRGVIYVIMNNFIEIIDLIFIDEKIHTLYTYRNMLYLTSHILIKFIFYNMH